MPMQPAPNPQDVDPNEIQFKQTNDKFEGAIDVVFAQETTGGQALTDLKKTLNLSASVDRFTAIRSKALNAGEGVALRPEKRSPFALWS